MIGEVTERVQIPKYMLSKKFMFTPEMISTGDLKKNKKRGGGGGERTCVEGDRKRA